jgi:bacteriochlorophyll 4-vinyl reductase
VVVAGSVAASSVGIVTSGERTRRLGLGTRKEIVRVSEHRTVGMARLRGLLDGIESVAGERGRDMALRHAGLEKYIDNPPAMSEKQSVPAQEYVAVVQALSAVLGEGSKPLLIYAGEETMRRAMEGMPKFFGPVMKFMPGGLKKQAIFRLLAVQGGKATGIPPTVEFDGGKVTFADPMCFSCGGRQSDEPVCHFEAGIFLGAAELTTGKKHRVTEVKCKAMGDEACVHVIEEVGGDA